MPSSPRAAGNQRPSRENKSQPRLGVELEYDRRSGFSTDAPMWFIQSSGLGMSAGLMQYVHGTRSRSTIPGPVRRLSLCSPNVFFRNAFTTSPILHRVFSAAVRSKTTRTLARSSSRPGDNSASCSTPAPHWTARCSPGGVGTSVSKSWHIAVSARMVSQRSDRPGHCCNGVSSISAETSATH